MTTNLKHIPSALVTMAANSGWLLTQRIIRLAIGLATSVWLTRYLGPSDFGLYSYVIALVLIFAELASVGMQSFVTRELVENPESRDEILGSAMTVRAVGAVVSAVVLFLLTSGLHPDADHRVAVAVFGLVLLVQPLGVVEFFYEAETRSRYIVWVQMGSAFLYLAMVATLIVSGFSVVWFLGARLAEAVVVSVGYLVVFAVQGYRPSRWRPHWPRTKRMLTEAWPLIISALGATLYLRIDQVMLGQMTSRSEVGLYAAAARLSEVWYFLPGIVVASAFPYLLRLRNSSDQTYLRRLQQLYDGLAWSGLAVAVAVTASAGWVIALLYGSAYSASAQILQIHIWAGVFIFMRAAFSKWLIAERLVVFSLVTQGAGAVANILLNLALIPALGGVGAAWATVASYATASYVSLFLFPSTRRAAWMMTRTLTAPFRYLARQQETRSHVG